MLLEESPQLLVDDTLDDALHLGRNQLVLRLIRELRVRVFHRDDGGQALADVVAAKSVLQVLEQALRLRVGVHGARQRGTEPGEVGSPILVLDVVREAVDRVLVGIVPLHRDIDLRPLDLAQHADGLVVHRRLGDVQIGDEFHDPAVEVELVRLVGALVAQGDRQTVVQVGELPQPLRKNLETELGALEDLGIRFEGHLGAGLLRHTDGLQRRHGIALAILLVPGLALALDLQLEQLGQRVHHRNADAMQTARNLVVRVVELSARVEDGHDDLGRRALLDWMFADGHAAAVVLDAHRPVEMDGHVDAVAVPGQGLVDSVVDDLVDHVVQPGAIIGVTDVHAGSLANRLEALQDLDALFVVRTFARRSGSRGNVAGSQVHILGGFPFACRTDRDRGCGNAERTNTVKAIRVAPSGVVCPFVGDRLDFGKTKGFSISSIHGRATVKEKPGPAVSRPAATRKSARPGRGGTTAGSATETTV